jgi:hypothetical protein
VSARLVVAHTWDGLPVAAEDQAVLTLTLDGQHLCIEVDAPFAGDPPPDAPPGPTDRLWEHEVVELFVVQGEQYTEIELGPFGHHLVLQLQGIRQPVHTGLPLHWTSRTAAGRWTGTASIARALLPAAPERCNAYRIHGAGDQRRYLAHAPVPGPGPDFHRLSHFVPWPRGLADQGLY